MIKLKLHGPIRNKKLKVGLLLLIGAPIVYVYATSFSAILPDLARFEPIVGAFCDMNFTNHCPVVVVYDPAGVITAFVFAGIFVVGVVMIGAHFYQRHHDKTKRNGL